jgi:penicillin-binding protein 1A
MEPYRRTTNVGRRVRYLYRFISICVISAIGTVTFAFAVVPQVATLFGATRSEAEPLNLDPLPERSLIYDSKGALVGPLPSIENRSPVTLDQIPSLVKRSILAVEDENFYSHAGVNLRATVRALFTNFQSGDIEQGGSTITMQLVKNALLTPERSLTRKTKEAILAYRLEQEMSKDEILTRYLNTVYFGNGAYGVQAAAETYFGKSIGAVSWPEAALMAAMIRDPRDYDPFTNPSLAIERRHIALQRLVETGDLTQAEADLYAFTPLPTAPSQVAAPPKDYFIEQVKQALLDDPSFNLGDDPVSRYNAVFKGGLRIYTTLDPSLQQKALDARNNTMPNNDPNGLFVIGGARVNTDDVCPKLNDGAGHCLGTAALVSVEPSTGAVRDLVGGPGFEKWNYDLATHSPGRQPGSSMKAFVLAAALEQGININDTIDGSQCAIRNPGGTPDPYVQKGEGGVASLVRQTAGSVNCAFLRLGQIVGIDKVIEQAKKMGVKQELRNVVSVPLGVNEITPLEMAGAYAAIANDGVFNAPYFVDKITDASGHVIYQHEASPQRVMSSQSARQEIVALQAVVTGGTGTRAAISGRPVAGKTGTTDKHGDAWFIGFTPQLATAVWMGSPESVVPMNSVGGINVFGGTFPALLWHNFMVDAMAFVPVEQFTPPDPSRGGKYLEVPKGKEVKQAPAPTTGTSLEASTSTPQTYPVTSITLTPPTSKPGKGPN